MKNKYSLFSLVKNAFSYHENWEKAWKDPEPKKEYDVVIIGGGGHGLATAYYLAKKHNMKNIAVVGAGIISALAVDRGVPFWIAFIIGIIFKISSFSILV